MPRLFWKFLFAFWGVLLLAGVAVAVVMGLRSPPEGPHERTVLDAATATLEHGGVAALRSFLADTQYPGSRRLVAVDRANRDAAGAAVDATVVRAAQELAGQNGSPERVRRARAPDGSEWLLFFPQHDDTLRQASPRPRGPEGPPGPPPSATIQIVALMVAGLVFSALLAWYVVAPIRRLRAAFEAAAQGDLKTRVSPPMRARKDELADLARDYDRMAQQLGIVMASQRRLLNDVSHELRSPLARMQAAIGLVRQNPGKIEPMLDRIERESARLDALVGEILTLVRLDASGEHPRKDSVNLVDLVEAIVDDANFEAQANGRRVEFDHDADPRIEGDYDALYRAVENVIRNAVRHTAEGTAVEVSVSARGPHDGAPRALLTVADRGPGVPDDELKAIFRPFYRASTSSGADGFGLGLAISSRAIAMHGGEISARARPGGGLLLEVEIPCSLPPAAARPMN